MHAFLEKGIFLISKHAIPVFIIYRKANKA